MNEVVLGIWDGHDAGAAVCVGGRLVAAVSAERIDRIKQQGGWPAGAIEVALRVAGVGPSELSRVALAGRTGRLPARMLDGRYAARPPQSEDPLSWPVRLYGAYQNHVATRGPMRSLERSGSRAVAARRLRRSGIRAPLRLIDHHLAHARGALAAIGGGPALVVTMDGYGDGVSTAVWTTSPEPDAQEGRWGLRRLAAAGPDSSLALLYGALSRLLGFAPGEEGKVTGLATRGGRRGPELARLVDARDGRIRVAHGRARRVLRHALSTGTSPAELAASLQHALEQAVVRAIRWHLERTGHDRLALAGGLFANVALNGRLAQLPLAELAVFAAMGDQGLCAGAAWEAGGAACRMGSVFVGDCPQVLPTEASCTSAIPRFRPTNLADRLAADRIVGVCRGPMEFGPRALGHRSILLRADRPALAARLSRRLRRPDFMPFAPLLADADWGAAFWAPSGRVRRAATEMTLALPVRRGFAARIPAALAPDGTARPQVVTPERDPWLAAVLAAFTARTGCPALINTSLNRHREPIVRTAEQALSAAREIGLDALVSGEEVVEL